MNKSISAVAFTTIILALSSCAPASTAGIPPPTAAPVSVTTVSAIATIAPATATTAPPTATAAPKRPNIVLILTDDQDLDSVKVMPKLKTLLIDQGVSFANFFVNISLCCPSRTTILRGQYAHNTGVFTNELPDGGFEKAFQLGIEKSTVAVWLENAGYKTMLAGKYLNGYPDTAPSMYIPPGWSEWYSAVQGNAYAEFGYALNENGKRVLYRNAPSDYGTDIYASKAVDFIKRMSKDDKPFFVYLSTYAPHDPATPAPRHANLFADAKAPRTPNFNEPEARDKPQYIRLRAPLTDKEIADVDTEYRNRLRSLMAVDEAIENVYNTLKSAGQLDNTYIFFASDNGYHLGNHRLPGGKQTPYEEDIHVPLFVRGPGIPAGKTIDHLVGNVDLAATWAELAGAKAAEFEDGRSLAPLWRSNPPPIAQWRQAYLIQNGGTAPFEGRVLATATPFELGLREPPTGDDRSIAGFRPLPSYFGIRTKDYTYAEHNTGEKELYDLKADPYQLTNIVTSAKPDLVKQLAARLAELKKCAMQTCRESESAPFQ